MQVVQHLRKGMSSLSQVRERSVCPRSTKLQEKCTRSPAHICIGTDRKLMRSALPGAGEGGLMRVKEVKQMRSALRG